MKIRNKTFLITGGAGFIGSHTAKALLKKGARVVVVDRMIRKKKRRIVRGTKVYEMNLASTKLEQIFKNEKPDYVFHFASNLLSYKAFDPKADMESVLASVNLLECVSRFGVKKFVFASSGIVYGNDSPQPTPETYPLNPANSYAVSKYVIEKYLYFYKETHNIPYVILRYPNAYGPGQTAGALTYYIRTLQGGGQAEIRGNGTMTRDYIFIDDIVRANIKALNVPDDFADPVFNIGTGKETSLNQLYSMIAKLLKKKAQPIYLPGRPGEQIRFSLDSSKFEKLLEWKAEVELIDGLRKTIKAYSHLS